MILYPDIQRKAQAAIDRVTGGTRLPEIDDRSSLPYLEAIMYESARWRNTAPIGEFTHNTFGTFASE